MSKTTTPVCKRWFIVVDFYLVASFVCSFRGNEGFLVDLHDLIDHINGEKGTYDIDHHRVVIP